MSFIIPSPLGVDSTEWSMWHIVSTQQIFITVITFIIHFKVHVETTNLRNHWGKFRLFYIKLYQGVRNRLIFIKFKFISIKIKFKRAVKMQIIRDRETESVNQVLNMILLLNVCRIFPKH